jgi:hypothetical protein
LSVTHVPTTIVGMNTANHLRHSALDLVEAARTFQAAAQAPASHGAAPDSLEALEEALQALSAAWYQLAADASPGIVERRRGRDSDEPSWPGVDGLSREQEVRLMGTLHDVAAAFARCARACRDGRAAVTPIIVRGVAAKRPTDRPARDDSSWFEVRERSTERVA